MSVPVTITTIIRLIRYEIRSGNGVFFGDHNVALFNKIDALHDDNIFLLSMIADNLVTCLDNPIISFFGQKAR